MKIKVINQDSVKDDASTLEKTLKRKVLNEVYRTGKELRLQFSGDIILGIHLMLRGKLYLFESTNENKNSFVEFCFENKGLALTDYQKRANVRLSPEEKSRDRRTIKRTGF